jgi:Uma2 family endonuclease
MPASTTQLTPEALLQMPRPAQGRFYELSDGELIVVGNAGALHELIKTKIFELLTEYRLRTRSGRAFSETQFALREDRARIPDVAWISQAKLDSIPRENRAIRVAPDLAVEIVSTSESPEETEKRLRDYLQTGCEVWQVFPSLASVTVWRGNEGIRLTGDELLVSAAVPDLALPVSEIFRP